MPAEKETAWQIVGSKGTLNMQMVPDDKNRIVFFEGDPSGEVRPRTVWEGGNESGTMSFRALEDFAAACAGGAKPATGLEESLVIQKLTDAVYESADTGKAARVSL